MLKTETESFDNIYKHEGIVDAPMPDWKITNGTPLQGKIVLNIGGGTSKDIWHLASNNQCVVLDASPLAISVAQRHGMQGILVDLNNGSLPFPDESVDVVICKDLLEHVLHPEVILSEIRRVVRKDGYAVINVPNHFYLTMRLKIFLGKGLIWSTVFHHHGRYFKAWDYMHIRFFTYKQFRELLAAAGLRPTKFFWDLGTFNHYCEPALIIPHFQQVLGQKPNLATKEKIIRFVILPALKVTDTLFPRSVRSFVASLRPGLLSACFYVWCAKTDQ